MNLRSALKTLLVLDLGLPLLSIVLTWVGGLLAAMGDNSGANVLSAINRGSQVLWLVAIVATMVVLALESLNRDLEE